MVGTVEGAVGDELLVRFGEGVLKVPPEIIEPIDEKLWQSVPCKSIVKAAETALS